MSILSSRLKLIPGVGKLFFSATDLEIESDFSKIASGLKLAIRIFPYSSIVERPDSWNPEKWGFALDEGIAECTGIQLLEALRNEKLDHAIVVPVTNLLVDAKRIGESLKFHLEETFDATFSADLQPGANWAIIRLEVLEGLQSKHPDLMKKRGGLYWALKKPLYPFKVGYFHAPRDCTDFSADLRFNNLRTHKVLSECLPPDFVSNAFSYSDWIKNPKWKKLFTDFGPSRLYIEPSNCCNSKCFGCPYPTQTRNRLNLSLDGFRKVASAFEKLKDAEILFSGIGEPFINPDFKQFVELPEISGKIVQINSGVLEAPPKDFNWPAVTHFRMSLDANDLELFTILRPGCSWEQILECINLIHLEKSQFGRSNPELGISFAKHRLNETFSTAFLCHWKEKCQSPFGNFFFTPDSEGIKEAVSWFQIIGASDFLGEIEYPGKIRYTPLKRKLCKHALLGFHLLSDGRVTICPFDVNGRYAMGDVFKEDPTDIWEKQANFRLSHINGELTTEPCMNCQDWYHP
ncbi:MAG: SPASM domain-containing protein [Candidatus Riflebacteria bacterium]|nr:SPASM domain-containing protein [Candidatus Riflebacteria bacterium]